MAFYSNNDCQIAANLILIHELQIGLSTCSIDLLSENDWNEHAHTNNDLLHVNSIVKCAS